MISRPINCEFDVSNQSYYCYLIRYESLVVACLLDIMVYTTQLAAMAACAKYGTWKQDRPGSEWYMDCDARGNPYEAHRITLLQKLLVER